MSVDTGLGGGMFRPPSPINVYTARRPHKRWTFWRVLRWTLAVVLMSGVTVGGAVAYYVWNRLERITTTNDPNLKAADQQLEQIINPATQPAIALVLGYDKRYGSGNSRGHSDTLMLIRVDPRTKVLSLLSLPRDLYVNIPGYGMSKINDAYANGGAPLAIKTVSQVLGVKINYYVPVNFHLFRKTVDMFHGVYIDVDRRYYHANNSAGNYAAIDLQPGYQKLSGLQALRVRALPPPRLRLHPHRAPAGVRARVQAPPRRLVGRHEPLRPARLAAERPQGARLGQGPVGRPEDDPALRQAAGRDPARQDGAGAAHRRHAHDRRSARS